MTENPYYHPEFFNLKLFVIDEDDLSYEYNTLLFFATPNGYVYTVADSGCSCPTSFAEYNSENVQELLHKIERVGSIEQAIATYDKWAERKSYRSFQASKSKHELKQWLKEHGTTLI